MNKYFSALLKPLLLLMSVTGCTRMEVQPTKFTFSIPQQKQLLSKSAQSTTGLLRHVVINVRGAGIAIPISMNYDAQSRESIEPQELPALYTVEIPSGTSRLIQVLAVYSETTSKNSAFFYGDATVNLNGGEVAVDIPMSLHGGGSTRSGRVAGRYFTFDGTSPSGRIESRFSPAGDKPPMIINKSSMTSGWFSAFALEDVPMDIVWADKEEKIFAGIQLDSVTISDNKSMKVTVPPFYQSYGGGSEGENREGTTAVIGFFGPGVPSGHKVCYTAASYTYTNLFQDSTQTNPLTWDAASTSVQNVTATKHSTVGTCSSTDASLAYTSVYPFNPSLFNNWGGDEALSGFYGVFKFPTSSNQGSAPVAVSFDNSGQFTSQFSVLPGMSNVFDSIGIYYRPQSSPREYEQGDEAPCSSIALGGYGFVRIASIPLVAGTHDYSISKPSPPDISMNAAFAYCPLKNNVAFGGGFINSHPWNASNSGGDGGGGGMGPAVEANSFQAHMMGQVGVGQCHRVHVSLINESNGTFNTNVTNSTIRSFTASNTMGLSFYANESSCLGTTSPVSSFSIPTNMNHGELWVRSGASPSQGTLTIQSPSSFGNSISKNINLTVSYPDTPVKIKSMMDKIFLSSNSCQMIELTAYDYNWIPSPFSANTEVPLYKYDLNGAVTDESFNFYADCNSSTAISSVTFNVGAYKATFAIKANGTPSSDRRIYIADFGPTNIYLNITPVANHVSMRINNGEPVYAGSCVPVTLQAEDNLNNMITSANFDVEVMSYHPTTTGQYGQIKESCNSSSGLMAPVMLTNGNRSLFFSAQNPTSGFRFETRSVFANQVRQTDLTILQVPQFARTTSAKVHLTSDTAPANLSSLGFWPSPQVNGPYLTSPHSYIEVGSGANPKLEGVLFQTETAEMSGPLNVLSSDNIALTARFKITTPGEATILGLESNSSELYQVVSAGSQHTCGIASTGRLKCWGRNTFGQIGDGTIVDKQIPTEIDPGMSYSQISVSTGHSCGITMGGVLKCWGQNTQGQLGDGTTINRMSPVIIDASVNYSQVSVGSLHTCGITTAGSLKCWGTNANGQLGDGTTTAKSTPFLIDSGTTYVRVAAAYSHTCGITTTSVLKCWGNNISGQLGDGTTTAKFTPVLIDSGTSYVQVAAATSHTCGITTAGSLKCWGSNSSGQIGDGTTTTQLSPIMIDSPTQYQLIATGSAGSCGITPSYQLKCWGANDMGQLGDGTFVSKTQPTLVGSPSAQFSSISMGSAHTCGVSSISMELRCWGQNTAGQLGLGDMLGRSNPTLVDNQDFKIFTEVINGSLRLKGTGGWEYANPLTVNTWYTVTLTREGSNVAGFVNGAAAGGSSTFVPSPGSYSSFKVGAGFVGALKAVLIDADASTGTGIGFSDHSYLLNRVP